MARHARIAGGLWAAVGLCLFAWSLWELSNEVLHLSFRPEYFILLGYGFIAALGGIYLYLHTQFGRVVVVMVAVLGFAYGALLVVLNAQNIASPPILGFGLLCVYGFAAAINCPKTAA